jgi:hypothetical protein
VTGTPPPRQGGLDTRHGSIAHAPHSAETATNGDHPGVIARPPRIAYLFLAVGGILGSLWPLPLWPAGTSTMLRDGIGGGLLALGLALAVRGFRAAGTNVETVKPATAIVTDGIYAWSRNPMYVALLSGACPAMALNGTDGRSPSAGATKEARRPGVGPGSRIRIAASSAPLAVPLVLGVGVMRVGRWSCPRSATSREARGRRTASTGDESADGAERRGRD